MKAALLLTVLALSITAFRASALTVIEKERVSFSVDEKKIKIVEKLVRKTDSGTSCNCHGHLNFIEIDGVRVGTFDEIKGDFNLNEGSDKDSDRESEKKCSSKESEKESEKKSSDKDSDKESDKKMSNEESDKDSKKGSEKEAAKGHMKITFDWTKMNLFREWIQAVATGTGQRKSISVIFHNDAGEEMRMNFFECWPTKWTGPALNAKNSGHASEELEITFEKIQVK
jgi:phage tail-like protein